MRIPSTIITVFAVAALVGFSDSAYLTAQHVRGVIPPCGLASNCETVLTSPYAVIGPMPVSVLGLLYYGTVLVLLVAYLDTNRRNILHWACWLASAGMLGTFYFLFVQAFLLHAWCLYCLTSAAMTTTMFGISVWLMRHD